MTSYYWRGRVYDFYADGQWSNSGAASLDFEPASQTLNLVNAQNRAEAQFQFTMKLPQQSFVVRALRAGMDGPARQCVCDIHREWAERSACMVCGSTDRTRRPLSSPRGDRQSNNRKNWKRRERIIRHGFRIVILRFRRTSKL